MPILTLFATFFNSILFYFKFGEKLAIFNLVGIFFAVLCAIFLGLDSMSKKGQTFTDSDGVEQSLALYQLISLGLAFLVPIGFTLKHYVIRKYKGSYNYNFLPVDSGIIESFTCLVFFIIWLARGEQVTSEQFWMGGLSGTFIMLGRILIAMGVAEGLGGPAQAVMSANGIWVTLLTVWVDG